MRTLSGLVVLLLVGCGNTPCRPNTLYLTIDYAGAAADGDALAIDLAVGGTQRHFERTRTPGQSRDTLEVVFGTYVAHAEFDVTATVSRGGDALAVAHEAAALSPSCTALALELSAGGSGANDLALAPGSDLASSMGGAHDLANGPPVDMAHLITTILFNGETDTELHPNGGNGLLPFDGHCTAGYAIVGFAYALATDGQGNTTGINRADALCIKPLVQRDDSGYIVTWDPGNASQIQGVGTADRVTLQYLCTMPAFLVGFYGRAGSSTLNRISYSCAPIVIDAANKVSMGPTVELTNGVGSETLGTPFGPTHCPANQVATSVISSGMAGAPPLSFGFGCSAVSGQ